MTDNFGDALIVKRTRVGIMSLTARDGAEPMVRGCRTVRNSRDGVALFRGASAVIEDDWIDGVTWNAPARVRRNAVRRYWEGIGAFVGAHVVAEGIATWGMTLWDTSQGGWTTEPVGAMVDVRRAPFCEEAGRD